MTFWFRMKLARAYILGWLTNGEPIYIRDSLNTHIKLARWKYDPWTETKTLVTTYGRNEHSLNDNGQVDDYSSIKWMYVSKSKRTMQKLKNG